MGLREKNQKGQKNQKEKSKRQRELLARAVRFDTASNRRENARATAQLAGWRAARQPRQEEAGHHASVLECR
jgi:hypothetical protein